MISVPGYLLCESIIAGWSLFVLVADISSRWQDVPVVGLQHSKIFTTSFHLVHLAFASACAVDRRHRSESFYQAGDWLMIW